MSTLKSRRLATMAFAMLFPLAAAPMAQAYPMPPLHRTQATNQPEASLRHAAEMTRMDALDLERDIDIARADITGLKYDEARQTAEVAQTRADTLLKAPPASVDATAKARMADADRHIATAVKLMTQNRPWEAQQALRTAKIDVEVFTGQPVS